MKIAWWQWWPFWRWRVVGIVESADEIPERLPRNGAVLVGSAAYPKWIGFDCPCRRGHRIMLNADKARRPAWRVNTKDGKLTIAPSVDFVGSEYRCHYFVRDGRIEWTKDNRR